MSADLSAAITIANVFCSRKGKTILEDITLEIASGSVVGLLGPNGAGKTTLIRLVAGLAKPDSGTITVCGEDAAKRSVRFRHLIGMVAQENTLENELTIGESLLYYARLYGIKEAKALVKTTAKKYHLEDFLDKRPDEISGGMKRRTVIARAAMTDPSVLLLDEPTVGLDPDLRQEIWSLIGELRTAGKTLLLTTHYMKEAESLCDRIAFLRAGKLRVVDTVEGIRKAAGAAKDLEQAFLRLSHEESGS